MEELTVHAELAGTARHRIRIRPEPEQQESLEGAERRELKDARAEKGVGYSTAERKSGPEIC